MSAFKDDLEKIARLCAYKYILYSSVGSAYHIHSVTAEECVIFYFVYLKKNKNKLSNYHLL